MPLHDPRIFREGVVQTIPGYVTAGEPEVDRRPFSRRGSDPQDRIDHPGDRAGEIVHQEDRPENEERQREDDPEQMRLRNHKGEDQGPGPAGPAQMMPLEFHDFPVAPERLPVRQTASLMV